MRNLDELIRSAMGASYTTSSGPVLEIVRELVSEGRFKEAGEVLQAWFNEFPHTRLFVTGQVPAIVLNQYLIKQPGILVDTFMRWKDDNQNWSKEIRAEADNPDRFPGAVEQLLLSIREHAQRAP